MEHPLLIAPKRLTAPRVSILGSGKGTATSPPPLGRPYSFPNRPWTSQIWSQISRHPTFSWCFFHFQIVVVVVVVKKCGGECSGGWEAIPMVSSTSRYTKRADVCAQGNTRQCEAAAFTVSIQSYICMVAPATLICVDPATSAPQHIVAPAMRTNVNIECNHHRVTLPPPHHTARHTNVQPKTTTCMRNLPQQNSKMCTASTLTLSG